MQRRRLFKAGLAVLFSTLLPAVAQAQSPRVDVVKVMSFSCPVCRASEAHDPAIARALQELGGRLVSAPVPTGSERETGVRERVYYASRDKGPTVEGSIKSALYKGAQDMAVPLDDYLQVYTWLQQTQPAMEADINAIVHAAQQPAAGSALARAVRLANNAGVTSLPAYVLLADNQIVTLLDPTSVSGNSLMALRDEVISRARKFSKR